MGQLLNGWRYRTLMLVTVLIPLAVRAFLTHPDWAEAAAPLQAQIAAQPTEALQAEMRVPLALGVMLPTGLLGLVVAAMLGAAISTDSGVTVDEVESLIQSARYIHTQGVASASWTINHGLGWFPSVTVVDQSKNVFYGDVRYIDSNSLVVTFYAEVSGTAYLN